jgi:hypothetical protein
MLAPMYCELTSKCVSNATTSSYSCTTTSQSASLYLHDGAPAYSKFALRHVFSNTCHGRRSDTGGATAWFPRSSDLNAPDCYLWEHLKFLCVRLLLTMERHFTITLWMPVKSIHKYTGIFERILRSMLRRVKVLIINVLFQLNPCN